MADPTRPVTFIGHVLTGMTIASAIAKCDTNFQHRKNTPGAALEPIEILFGTQIIRPIRSR